MGAWEGFRCESDKYVYFYEKKQGHDYSWEVIDKKSGELLPFIINSSLGCVGFDDDCCFTFRYKLNELSDKERKSEKLVELANDILKDFIIGEHYNYHELDVYTKDIIKNALDPNGGFKDGIKSLYEEFIEEVDKTITEEEDFLETNEARESRKNRIHMMTTPSFIRGFGHRQLGDMTDETTSNHNDK